jgi:hypothetical protein
MNDDVKTILTSLGPTCPELYQSAFGAFTFFKSPPLLFVPPGQMAIQQSVASAFELDTKIGCDVYQN